MGSNAVAYSFFYLVKAGPPCALSVLHLDRIGPGQYFGYFNSAPLIVVSPERIPKFMPPSSNELRLCHPGETYNIILGTMLALGA